MLLSWSLFAPAWSFWSGLYPLTHCMILTSSLPLWLSVFYLRMRVLQIAAVLIFPNGKPGQSARPSPGHQVEACHDLQDLSLAGLMSSPLLCCSHTELLLLPPSPGPLKAFVHVARLIYNSSLSFTWFVPTHPSSVSLITSYRKTSSLIPPIQDGQGYFRSPLRTD